MARRLDERKIRSAYVPAVLMLAGALAVGVVPGPRPSSADTSGGPTVPAECTVTATTTTQLLDQLGTLPTGLQRVCLAAGTYDFSRTGFVLTRPNTAITGPSSGTAVILGRTEIRGDHVTLSGLTLTRYAVTAPLAIFADHVTVASSSITNRRGICVSVGYADATVSQPIDGPKYQKVHDVVITRNEIDGCADDPDFLDQYQCANDGLPGIYSAWADGLTISENIISDTALRGIQLYPFNRNVAVTNNLFRRNSIAMNVGISATALWTQATNISISNNVFAEQSSQSLVNTHPTMQSSCSGSNNYLLYNSPMGVTVDDQVTGNVGGATREPPEVLVSGNCGAGAAPRLGASQAYMTWVDNTDAAATFISPNDNRQAPQSACGSVGPATTRSPALSISPTGPSTASVGEIVEHRFVVTNVSSRYLTAPIRLTSSARGRFPFAYAYRLASGSAGTDCDVEFGCYVYLSPGERATLTMTYAASRGSGSRITTTAAHGDTTAARSTVVGGSFCSLPYGTPANDTLVANTRLNGVVLCGFAGSDKLTGGIGGDRLIGGPGNDELNGLGGSDILSGGMGRDTLRGGQGRDRCDTGPGADSTTGCETTT